jgi:hypothetical protein
MEMIQNGGGETTLKIVTQNKIVLFSTSTRSEMEQDWRQNQAQMC